MKDDEFVTYLSPAAFDAFLEALDNPKPPSQALIDLMRRVPPWQRGIDGIHLTGPA